MEGPPAVLGALLEGFDAGEMRDAAGRWVHGATSPRHGSFKIGDRVTYETGSREAGGHGPVTFTRQPGVHEVVGFQRNGNLRLREPKFGTTVDAHHTHVQLAGAPATLTYRERRAARSERLRGWADSREAKANADYERGRAQVSMIPLGEPIHSRQDANRRRKAFAPLERSFEHARKAESMRSRADEIDRQAARSIYSDDPNAAVALRAKLGELEARREKMKAYNAHAKKQAKVGGVGDVSLLHSTDRAEVASGVNLGRPFIGPGNALPAFHLRNLGGNITRTRQRLAQLEKAQESAIVGVLDSLLEGFAAAPAADFEGQPFTKGDQVRVSVGGGASSMTGRVVRPHGGPPATHAVIAPEGGGAHVLAPVDRVKLNTPAQHAAAAKRRDTQAARDEQRKAHEAWMAAKPGGPAAARPGRPAASMREGVSLLLGEKMQLSEAFGPAAPGETPAQSQQIGAQNVAQAQKAVAAGWNPSKHPRASRGQFGYTTGGKRAARGPSSSSRTLGVGAKGALVRSVQRQVGAKVDGLYGRQTHAAVARYQRQHGLQVDGVVGAQTLASLRGSVNARLVAPGPISSRAATVRSHPLARRQAGRTPARPAAPLRVSGGVVV